MSLFSTIETECPACGVTSRYELAFSVNADRRPELRAQMLHRTFQRLTCPACGQLFRIEPQFTYIHAAGHQFLTVWPADDLPRWPEQEARAVKTFNRFWGAEADPVAAQIGSELVHRVAFGWEAAHEKIVVVEAGIDDVSLELAKLALLRTQDDIPIGESALRLVGIDADNNLVLGLFKGADEHVLEQYLVPRALLSEIEADAEAWAPLREQLSEGPFVDIQRLLTVPVAA
ncbi:MAG TPA: CpXC domain-containing protein [Stellaceae bacterium]|nr:CpXC domain-containing protein [Stellaceae bacterium]